MTEKREETGIFDGRTKRMENVILNHHNNKEGKDKGHKGIKCIQINLGKGKKSGGCSIKKDGERKSM